VQKDKKTIAFIDGHGEANVFETVESAFALEGFYEMDRVRMNQNPAILLKFSEETNETAESSTKLILPAYDAIVIVEPKHRISDIDKWAIDQYIMYGGKVLWALNASDASLDSLRGRQEQFALIYPQNFGDMLFRYGVRINSNLILDLNCGSLPLVTGNIGDQPQTEFFRYPFLPILVSQNQHPIVKNLNPIRSEFSSSIDTLENDIDKKILLTTSPYTRTVGLPTIVNFDLLKENPNPNDYRRGELPVAVLLEGEFESHFRNRMAYGLENISIPMKHQSKFTQMIVISDADIIKNRFSFEQNHPLPMGFDPYTKQTYANKTFLVNCMNYLLDGSLLLDLRAKVVKLRLLDKQRIEQEKNKWLLLILGLPTLLVIFSAVGFMGYRKWRYAR
jgi:ABC-2 type transport system permease protein